MSAVTLLQSFDQEARLANRDAAADLAAKSRAEALAEGALAGRQEGFDEGFEDGRLKGVEEGLVEGRRQGEAAALSARDAAIAGLRAAMSEAAQARAEAERRLAGEVGAALRAATAALLPRLARRGLADEVAQLSEEILARAACAEAELSVAPDLVEEAEASLAALDLKSATLTIRADAALGPLTARLRWPDGLAEFDAEDAATRILARLDAAAEEPRNAADAAPDLV